MAGDLSIQNENPVTESVIDENISPTKRQYKPNLTLDDLKGDSRFQDLEPLPPKNLLSLQCTKLSKQKNIPSKRTLFSQVQINPRDYFFYSGILDKEKRLNELHTFKLARRVWGKIVPAIDKVLPPSNLYANLILRDTKKIDPLDSTQTQQDPKKAATKAATKPPAKSVPGKPGAKRGAKEAASANYEDLTVIHFGNNGHNSLVPNMYEFDLTQKKWKTLSPSGDIPKPSHGHSVLYYKEEDLIVYFGGCGYDSITESINNSVYLCYISGLPQTKKSKKQKKKVTHVWQRVEVEGPQPSPRYGHIALWYNENNMLIHGGTDGKNNFDDVWIFNVPTRKWTKIQVTAESEDHQPQGGRYHHSACMIGNTLWISFGVPFNSDFFSLEIPEAFETETAVWNRYTLQGESLPARRWGHNMIVHNKGSKEALPSFMIMFGCDIVGKYHNDCWIIADPKTSVQVFAEDE